MNRSYTFFAIALLLSTQIAQAQWVQTSGSLGGAINCITVSGTDFFAGVIGGGIFHSTDDGTTWVAANIGLPRDTLYERDSIFAFAVSGTNLFAATYGGVFRSTNNGNSWIAANAGIPLTTYGSSMYAFAVDGANLFVGANGSNAVSRSTNNGTSWTKVSTGLGGQGVSALAVCGTNLFAGTWQDGGYKSTNKGTR